MLIQQTFAYRIVISLHLKECKSSRAWFLLAVPADSSRNLLFQHVLKCLNVYWYRPTLTAAYQSNGVTSRPTEQLTVICAQCRLPFGYYCSAWSLQWMFTAGFLFLHYNFSNVRTSRAYCRTIIAIPWDRRHLAFLAATDNIDINSRWEYGDTA